MRALYKAYNSKMAWKDIGGTVQVPHYPSKHNHWKIRDRKQKTGDGKFSFVNWTIADSNQLSEDVIGFSR
jgi:hypothetical protein